jgi:hypothetical protein
MQSATIMRISMLFVAGSLVSVLLACSSVDPGVSGSTYQGNGGSANSSNGSNNGSNGGDTSSNNGTPSNNNGGGSANPEPGSAGNPDDAGGGSSSMDATAADSATHSAEAGAGDAAADGAAKDGGAGEAGAGIGAFGAVCTKDADCKSNACFIGGQGSYCSILCQTDAQCPVPPTAGKCNMKGYCMK